MAYADGTERITGSSCLAVPGDVIRVHLIKLWNHCDTIPIRKHWEVFS
ncbi:hypothetical protein APHNP_1144 [Anaplasma phagocytophilum str. ApNP]|uniref:Uncharacterized protein n=1 Tax=Anaplasma phagocytophilum str. ApNP TaxID=1359153 RepID=A0A0F3NID6_ANAPH|nr:hypothetical protein APHNP_1144 [Anaplasma phagocytophilum str. ApNP]